ncbi:MAG TPA: hypothetical protein VHE78_11045 [Gemmatimonadaceae bacterium]|nr:hypothetical protein [Gemmatimonadaceae bacterium]
MSLRRSPLGTLAALTLLLAAVIPAAAQQTRAAPTTRSAPAGLPLDTALYSQLKWRHIGPEGNRVTSVAGVPGDPNLVYAGAASGGLWKSSDGGIHWRPIFDKELVSSIGAIAVAPSDPNVVWAGTGEPFTRSHISAGWGMYKSVDAGKTWAKVGLENTGRISRIVLHPTNPDIAYAASLGFAYGPQQERGIYRTTDGGKTWERVLFVNDSTGASDLVIDPNNPRILFAGFWQIEIKTWGRMSGGPGSGIWTSRDGGTTWKRLTGNGLPTKPVGKIGLAMSKANSNRVYALIETGDGVPAVNIADPDKGRLFRSDDGGEHWQLVSNDRQLAGRTHYYNRMGVEPDNENEAYFLTASWAKTLDGGRTIIDPPFEETAGGDHHDIWIDPTNGNRILVSHDGGVSISTNRTKSWRRVQLPIAQMYHVTTDNRIPYYVYGNRQDGPSARGPSNSKYGGIPRGAWMSVGGGESGWATPDPVDSNLVWSSASGFGSVGGIVTRHDLRTGITDFTEVWPEATIGHSAAEVKYRFVWTFPLTISPNDHNKVYVGSQFVHVTTNGGKSWQVISPDLTRNDKSHQKSSGGLTPDNIGVEYAGVVFAIAESRLEPGLIWAGTNDGKVQLTRDGGTTWTDLSGNIPGLLEWGTVSNIEPSRFDKGAAYLTVDGHQVNNRDPWIYKTTDYGRTWSLIVTGIPKSPLSYAHVVREDPVRRGLLYAGTENGLYVSFNDGALWQPLQNNLPHAPVYWVTVQENFSDLVIATYGRGFWILDDISPLRAVSADIALKDAHLFAPRRAYRFRGVEGPFTPDADPVVGTDPPYGAALHYWLKAEPKDSASKDSVKIEILDAAGVLVRAMKGPAKAGLNRAWWDLTYDPTKEARLRVSPLLSPWREAGTDGIPAPGVPRVATLVQPGTYTVRLSVAGQALTQPMEILKDPNSGGSPDEIRAQTVLVRSILADVDTTVNMINTVEGVRGQLAALKSALASDDKTADLRAAADSLDKQYVAVEEELFQIRVTGRGQDQLRWPMKLAEQLGYLAGQVASSDYAPKDAQREVHVVLQQRMRASRAALDKLTNESLAAFRKRLRDRNVSVLIM